MQWRTTSGFERAQHADDFATCNQGWGPEIHRGKSLGILS